jgi:hypothetical protein
MNDAYRIPKHKVPAVVSFPEKEELRMYIFLADCARSHTGHERPSDLLNGTDPFFPAADFEGGIHFIHRDALSVLTVKAEFEFPADGFRAEDLAPDESTRLEVEVELENGNSLEGTVAYLMPEGHRRLQDVLNLDDRFLILRDGDNARLINKRRIERISPQSQTLEMAHGAN